MSRHFLLQSFEVEGASASWGLPIVAPGQQPTVRRPESYPEYLQTFVSQAEFEALWDKIDDIVQVSLNKLSKPCHRLISENRLPVEASRLYLPSRCLSPWNHLRWTLSHGVYFLPCRFHVVWLWHRIHTPRPPSKKGRVARGGNRVRQNRSAENIFTCL